MDSKIKMEEPAAPRLEHATASPASFAPAATANEPAKTKPYRSWKKKYQKMRIAFDDNMEANEVLHKQEVIALHTTKRLAVEIECVFYLPCKGAVSLVDAPVTNPPFLHVQPYPRSSP